jgi:hypothetical protein
MGNSAGGIKKSLNGSNNVNNSGVEAGVFDL